MKLSGAALALLLLLTGCSMSQRITVAPSGAGTATIQVQLGSLVVRYMKDVLGSLGSEPRTPSGNPTLFDLTQIRHSFEALHGVTITSLSSPAENRLDLAIAFDNINSLFPATPGQGPSSGGGGSASPPRSPLHLTTTQGVTTLRFELSRQTWPAVAALPALRNDPLLSSLGPGRQRTKTQYLDLLSYAFADYATKEEVGQAVNGAMVDVTVAVKGTLVSEHGGVREGNQVHFHLPLIDLVTLERPVDWSVSFR